MAANPWQNKLIFYLQRSRVIVVFKAAFVSTRSPFNVIATPNRCDHITRVSLCHVGELTDIYIL